MLLKKKKKFRRKFMLKLFKVLIRVFEKLRILRQRRSFVRRLNQRDNYLKRFSFYFFFSRKINLWEKNNKQTAKVMISNKLIIASRKQKQREKKIVSNALCKRSCEL